MCQTLLLKIHNPGEFSSNPASTHMFVVQAVLKQLRRTLALSGVELNISGFVEACGLWFGHLDNFCLVDDTTGEKLNEYARGLSCRCLDVNLQPGLLPGRISI